MTFGHNYTFNLSNMTCYNEIGIMKYYLKYFDVSFSLVKMACF